MAGGGAVSPLPVAAELAKHTHIGPGDVSKLRSWLEQQPHLPAQYITDLDLIITLHCCERSAEVAKQVLDHHFTLRTLFTGLFKDRVFDRRIENCLNVAMFAPLPTPTAEGHRGIYCRLIDADARLFNFPDTIRSFMAVFDLWQLEEGSWPGLLIVIDLDTVSMGHIAKLDVMTIRQTLYFLQEAMLVRLQEVHFLNAPSFMDKLMMLLRPFMKRRLLDIIRIHEVGSREIYKRLPKDSFPKNVGGEYKDFDTIRDETISRVRANSQFLVDENRRRVTESLRPGAPTTVAGLFGIEGSFKKLDID